MSLNEYKLCKYRIEIRPELTPLHHPGHQCVEGACKFYKNGCNQMIRRVG